MVILRIIINMRNTTIKIYIYIFFLSVSLVVTLICCSKNYDLRKRDLPRVDRRCSLVIEVERSGLNLALFGLVNLNACFTYTHLNSKATHGSHV